ncbi:MAG: polyprenyl diphosphate synthase [Patescibacteria group bacterium]
MSPNCIGIILGGNRRFARAHNLPLLEGHRRGFEKVKEVAEWTKDEGISHLMLFVFSTENWNRSKEEVSYLMDLFRHVLADEIEHMQEKGVRVLCIGARERFSPELQALMRQAEERTAGNKELTLALCLSYGGRAEIVGAVNRAIAAGKKEVDEETFARYLWTVGIPDPDLIIRTSGEMRLSGFLPWQGVYSELFFTKTLWPDFTEAEFKSILEEFSRRDRRLGR